VTLGVIVGLKQEADCFSGVASKPHIVCTGARSGRATVLSRFLIEDGCDALLSFGMAGGLVPELRAGDVIVADAIVTPDQERLIPNPRWRQLISDSLIGKHKVISGTLAGVDQAVLTPAAKSQLHHSTGCLAVDMESHEVASVAQQANVPFLAVRAVSDPADQAIPAWMASLIGENGQLQYGKVISGLISHPGDITRLPRLSRDSRAALEALRRVAGVTAGFSLG